MDFSKRYLKHLDYWILFIILLLGVFSYLGISSAKPDASFATKQVIWFGIGFVALAFVLLIDYEVLSHYTYVFYGFGLLLLMVLLIVADETKGIVGWFEIGSVKFQPSELMKIITIITLATYLDKRDEHPFERFIDLYPIFLIVGAPLFLILLQPDLGTALVFVSMTLSMMLVYGVKFRHFAILGGIGATGIFVLTLLYNFKQEVFFKIIALYQWKRLTSFIDPSIDPLNSGYQVTQSLIAVGSGMLKGVGLQQGRQGRNNWVPEAHTDFIFSVLSEELGFIGSSLLILLFFLLIYRIVRIGIESKDRFGTYVAAGLVGMWVFTIFENVGMTISIMPITGIPLPFVSYGGSSILSNFLSIGLILSIGMRKKTLMFDS